MSVVEIPFKCSFWGVLLTKCYKAGRAVVGLYPAYILRICTTEGQEFKPEIAFSDALAVQDTVVPELVSS